MAKSADAADLKSAEVYPSWGFKSPSGHHEKLSRMQMPLRSEVPTFARSLVCRPVLLTEQAESQNKIEPASTRSLTPWDGVQLVVLRFDSFSTNRR